MKNLLKADFFHILKDKTLYILLGIVFILPPAACIIMGDSIGVEKLILDVVLSTNLFCAIMGIALSLIFGKDYAHNTIRNKICYGHSRFKVMLSLFIEAIVITLVFILVGLVSSLAFGAMFGTLSFTAGFVGKFFCQVLILLAFACFITAFIISTKSMKAGFVVTLVLSVILSSVSSILISKATTSGIAKVISVLLYTTVSSLILSSSGGVYGVFNGVYLNAVLVGVGYIIISVLIATLFVRKQNYK